MNLTKYSIQMTPYEMGRVLGLILMRKKRDKQFRELYDVEKQILDLFQEWNK